VALAYARVPTGRGVLLNGVPLDDTGALSPALLMARPKWSLGDLKCALHPFAPV
jgi:hypothetical protein